MTEETKKRIDSMSYESMLALWRTAPIGHPLFLGKTGDYYAEVMKQKRAKVGDAEHVRASKNIGWN